MAKRRKKGAQPKGGGGAANSARKAMAKMVKSGSKATVLAGARKREWGPKGGKFATAKAAK